MGNEMKMQEQASKKAHACRTVHPHQPVLSDEDKSGGSLRVQTPPIFIVDGADVTEDPL
jgi:hypothetical protein